MMNTNNAKRIIIKKICVSNEGYVYCKSNFYTANDLLSEHDKYIFYPGINKLIGEIDSGNWAVSCLLSTYEYSPEDFVLFNKKEVFVNESPVSLNCFSQFSCYMDRSYPLFASDLSVYDMVSNGLKQIRSPYTPEEIKRTFLISNDRFHRPLRGTGNEIFKAMAAIGFSYGKQVFCFPWLSQMRYKGYHQNITDALDILADKEKIVLLPLGK